MGWGSHHDVEAGRVFHEEEVPRRVGIPGRWRSQCSVPLPMRGAAPQATFSPRLGSPSPGTLPIPSLTRHPRPHPFLRLNHSRRLPAVEASAGSAEPGAVGASLGGPSVCLSERGSCRVVRLSVMGCTPPGSVCLEGIPPPRGLSVLLAVCQDTSGCWGVCPFS